MMDVLDIYGYVLATAGPEDDRIVEYWDLVCATPKHARTRILLTRQSSPALIHHTIAACDHEGEDPKGTRRNAAANPNTPPGRLESWTYGKHGFRCASRAAANPGIADQLDRLHDRVNNEVATHMLANPGATTEFIDRHWRASPSLALTNPRCSIEVINDCCADGTNSGLLISLLSNPEAPRAYIDTAAGHPDAAVRAAAARHHSLSAADLDAIEAAEQARIDTAVDVLRAVQRSRIRLERRADPLSTPVELLHRSPYRPEIAQALLADTTRAAAARHLIGAGFEGTVAELLAVADTFEQ